MSPVRPHARHFAGASRFLLWLTTTAAATGCASDVPTGASAEYPGVGDKFGSEADPFPDAGAAQDGALEQPGDASSGQVSVRLLHSVVNLGPLYACYDADLVLDDPLTAAAEEQAGPVPPQALQGLEATFGEVSEPSWLPPWSSGVLTLHLRPTLEDAGVPDAGLAADADAQVPNAQPCGLDTRVAALALSPPAEEADAGDAGTSLRQTALVLGSSVTLVASGVALDPERLEERRVSEDAAHLAKNPGAFEAAAQHARDVVAELEATLGPALHVESDGRSAARADRFQLSLSQLVPDVAGSAVGPGAVRLCVTVGTLESTVEPPSLAPAIEFRTRRALTPAFQPELSYRFRVFPAGKFDSGGSGNSSGQDCKTTSLTPLAELSVPAGSFQGGLSYNLVFLGAVAPSSLCLPVGYSYSQQGCPLSAENYAAALRLR